MSDSVRPQRRQPTRLPHPWDSPGKNTGVGCHFLLQCRKVKSEREVAQSCLTLSDLMDYSPPGSSIHGIFQAKVLEWGAIAFSGSSDHELLIAKFRLKLKKVGKTTRPFRYDLNHDSSKALSKDQGVGGDPVPGNSHLFPKIVGIILPLISIRNYPAHKN